MLFHAARIALVLAVPLIVGIGCGGRSSSPQPKPAEVVFEDRLVVSDTDDKTPLRIPRAQLPAPGNCRVWYPGRPLGQQPPPQACAAAETSAPPETWILYRPREDPRLIHVRILDPDQAGAILQIRVYDAERGTYLGTKLPKRTSVPR